MVTTPHVATGWSDTFVLALRRRGVSGQAIGNALWDVESFCADSGEQAEEAFGPAAQYAEMLPLGPASGTAALTAGRGTLLRAIVSVLAVVTLAQSAGAWERGGLLEIGVADLALLVVFGTALVLAVQHLDRLLQLLYGPVWRPMLLAQLPFVVGVGVALLTRRLWPEPLIALPAAPLTALAAVALLVPAAVELARRGEPDPATVADTVAGPFDDPATTRRQLRRIDALTALAAPLAGAVATALVLVTDALMGR